ncbi:carboxylesterase family protein [Zavarzinella formosa]|uniref:carboxylesterase family protein n=1 Tax=Zavarzinella formosa TaxID=360055 RepID=UPI0005931FE3|nr:prolyl oligopeptidase family serine peptidase [Zavarzinella formosa]
MKWLSGLFAAFSFGLSAHAADTGFIDKVHKDSDGKEAKYVVYVPKDYDGKKEYPVILFLHGSGETGTDGKKQVATGLGGAIKKMPDFGFITIFPQSQLRSWQAGKPDADRALAILEAEMKTYKTDPKRVYLTGLSMGGYGTWSLAAKYPDKWAAIVPVCGGGNPADASKIKDIPCWDFHGDADKAVNVEKSREMIKALKAAGAEPKYTEYPGVGHNSWDQAYGTKELYPWLLKHAKK